MKDLNKNRLFFIIFDSRSGSTLLSSLLSNLPSVGVTIESSFLRSFLKSYKKIENKSEIGKILNKLYKEEKFRNWSIDRGQLINKVTKSIGSLDVDKIVRMILSEYFMNDAITYYCYRCPNIIWDIDKVYKHIKNPKFILINRDPRAVYSSQKNSKISNINAKMTYEPFSFSFHRFRFNRQLKKIKSEDMVHITYEDLIRDCFSEVQKIYFFITDTELRNGDKELLTCGSQYFERIPENQKHLHRLINSRPDINRINAWRNQLTGVELYFLELFNKNEIEKYKYSFTNTRLKDLRFKDVMKFIFYSMCSYTYKKLAILLH